MENCQNLTYKAEKNESRQKSIFTTQKKKPKFNPNAKPFEPTSSLSYHHDSSKLIAIGPSQVPVDAKVFKAIASTRQLPVIPVLKPNQFPLPSTSKINGINCDTFDEAVNCTTAPPPFETNCKRDVIVFKREFGPVATQEGVELRLKHGVRVFISVEGGILVENGDIQISASSNKFACALEHPMGCVAQLGDRADIIAFDGMANNSFIRYAKIWKDSIALTARGCALTYLLDTAGTRTTSEVVNRFWSHDYCKEIYLHGMDLENILQTSYAADHYRYRVDDDGTDIFHICNVRVAQTEDGMVRIQSEPFSIRTSVENRNVTLKTPLIHCTASMGSSPHLFVRMNERRVHFDGSNFVARNMGHSCSFDEANNLRIH